eukprot:3069867-Prymnesium_polylepis.1
MRTRVDPAALVGPKGQCRVWRTVAPPKEWPTRIGEAPPSRFWIKASRSATCSRTFTELCSTGEPEVPRSEMAWLSSLCSQREPSTIMQH